MFGKTEKGFTLVELVVAMVVLGVVATIALPGLTRLIESNQLTTSANDLVGALNAARSEAVRMGRSVSVTPVGTFTQGYQIVAAGGAIINSFSGAEGGFVIALSQGNNPRFSATGMLLDSNSVVFQVCKASGEQGSQVSITAGGQVSSSQMVCP